MVTAEDQSIPTVDGAKNIYAVLCTDKPGAGGLRDRLLTEHLSFVEAHFDRYRVAGPLYDESGAMTRSLFVIRAESLAEAKAFMAQDPYVAGGLYEAIEYRRFLPAVGDWIGGKVWDDKPAE
jgi:hypothetical protein